MRVKIGVLPSLVTLGNLVCGFAAICVTAQAQLHWKGGEADPIRGWESFALAGGLILLAMVFDALDGKIARLANLTSEFGSQLDSLCDMVSFGIAPAYIVFLEATSRELFGHYRYAWVCAVLFAICAALRLARFNVETEPTEESHRYFRGLPCPAAAGLIASLAIFDFHIRSLWVARSMPFAAIILGALMISRIRYVHLFNVLFRERKPFTYLVVFVFTVFAALALAQHYEYILLGAASAYALSGPTVVLWARIRRRKHRGREGPADGPADGPAPGPAETDPKE